MELQRLFHASQAVYILLHRCGTVGLDIHISSTERYVGSTIHNLLHTNNKTSKTQTRLMYKKVFHLAIQLSVQN